MPDFSNPSVRTRWIRAGVLVLAGLVALRLGWRALVAPAVPVLEVTRGPLVQTVVATGRVRADTRARLGAQVSGAVTRVLVREGDTVRAGQLLVELDPSEQAAALRQARANLQQIREVRRPVTAATLRQEEAALQKAEADSRRLTALRDGGAASDDQLETARQALEAARSQRDIARAQTEAAGPDGADVRIAEAAIAAAEARLSYTRITAPDNGVVLIRAVEP
ncbi:MAG TPA: biotin/lipoyl-binding protein, partial [Gemmatimonadales bacterium]|nr:biotin/lipoyl-binding protein [Gemmatimonadales bacterium]